MNWERIKSFLIVVFVLINLFLIGFMALSFYTSTSVSNETIADTVEILAANQITLDPDIIPRSVGNLQNFDVRNMATDGAFPGSYTVDEIGRFSYSVTLDETVSLRNAKSVTERLLKEAGIREYASIGQPQLQQDGSIQIAVAQTIQRYTVFNSTVAVRFMENTATVSGSWYQPETMPRTVRGGRDLVYITSVLVDFINNPERPAATAISSIAFGYRVSDYNSGLTHKTIPAVPCYRIVTADGAVYDYNARTGEYFARESTS